MAIAFRSATTNSNAGATTLVITPPASLADNDVMIAVICVNVDTTAITAPAGWTLIRSLNTTFTARASLYRKLAASESGSYTWTFDSSQRSAGAIAAFTGVNTISIVDVENGQTGGGTANAVAPTITTTLDNDMLVYAGADDSSTVATWTPPTGMAEAADSNSAQSVEIAYVLQAVAGATGTKTGVCTNAIDAKGAFLVALKASASASATGGANAMFFGGGLTLG
jgi:hypothetical protein